jgi:hypothetical protein
LASSDRWAVSTRAAVRARTTLKGVSGTSPARPMTASTVVAPLLDGPVRPLTLAHRSRHASQLADEQGRVVLAVTFPGAVRLPYACAVTSSSGAPSSFSVGNGALVCGEDTYTVARWWRPARPRPEGHQGLAAAVDLSGVHRLSMTWRDLLGRGPGLTPYGDDVVCGALLALHAAGHPTVDRLTRAISRHELESSTTATSAALLRAACQGYCIDELADHLAALCGAADPGRTRGALLAVGSSSGRGLLEGISLVLPGPTSEEAA